MTRPLVLDQEDPDYQGLRFRAAAYRTTRALLLCRHLLNPGQALTEAYQELVSGDLFGMVAPIDPASVLGSIGALTGPIATLPHPEMEPQELRHLATAHATAAIKLGYNPDDQVVAWLQPGQFEQWFPSALEMLSFDAELVATAGKICVEDGRGKAFAYTCSALEHPSIYERKDWNALPLAHIRDFGQGTTDDDRTLMVARLEGVAERAKNALDVRTELMALRLIASVQGLTFADEAKGQRELLLLLGNRTRERSIEAATSPHSVKRQIAETKAS